jgi:hypothetical protein
MLLTLTAENAELLVSSTDDEPMLSPLIYSFLLSVSDNSLLDGQPPSIENTCGFLSCRLLTSSTHLVYWALF